jgi:hypothetical protein
MSARSQKDRVAALPIPEELLVEGLAQALYECHTVPPSAATSPGTPEWHSASEPAREWMRQSARAALAYLRTEGIVL